MSRLFSKVFETIELELLAKRFERNSDTLNSRRVLPQWERSCVADSEPIFPWERCAGWRCWAVQYWRADHAAQTLCRLTAKDDSIRSKNPNLSPKRPALGLRARADLSILANMKSIESRINRRPRMMRHRYTDQQSNDIPIHFELSPGQVSGDIDTQRSPQRHRHGDSCRTRERCILAGRDC